MTSPTRLPFELWVALRYLRSTRKDAFISLLSRITGAGLAVLSYHDCTGDRCGPRAGLAATSLLTGLILGVSAAYGFSTAHLCRDAEAAHARHLSRRARPRGSFD